MLVDGGSRRTPNLVDFLDLAAIRDGLKSIKRRGQVALQHERDGVDGRMVRPGPS